MSRRLNNSPTAPLRSRLARAACGWRHSFSRAANSLRAATVRERLALALVALTAFGQQAPAPQAPAGRPTFSTTASLVVVDVTVKDKSGNLIEGLKENDF